MKTLSFLAALAAFALTSGQDAHADTTVLIGAKDNFCLDVKDGGTANGTQVQLWQCSGSDNAQVWKLSNGAIKAANGKCLDLTNGGGNGTKLQLYTCSGGPNQQWAFNGSAIQNSAKNLCLDVTDGAYQNGTLIQAYQCDWRSTGNQVWSYGAAQVAARSTSQSAATTGATTFYGYPAISIDDFMSKNTECAWIKDAVVAAAADQGLNSTFLATACIVESSCTVPANGWGPFQFSDDGAWAAYGGQGKDRQNVWDAAYGAARYFKALLAQENGNLDNALRAYNGPLSQGGNPQYQNEFRAWMSGKNAWEMGI